jgi:hypothetical protein
VYVCVCVRERERRGYIVLLRDYQGEMHFSQRLDLPVRHVLVICVSWFILSFVLLHSILYESKKENLLPLKYYSLLPNLGCILGLVNVKLYKVGSTIYENILTFIIPNVYNINIYFMMILITLR